MAAMPRCRPFKLIDAMIVIAAAAVMMVPMRTMLGRAGRNGTPWYSNAVTVHASLTMLVMMLVVAYIWIRMVPPRLAGSDLIRQPGMLFLGLMIGLSMPLLLLSAFIPPVAPTNRIFALALGSSWYIACRRYRSRAEPGWIEGLGRFFGVGLVVAMAAG